MSKDGITLITRADDCGMTHSANMGIVQALEAGFLKNVSLMAPCKFIEEAAELLAKREEVCFGMHSTLIAWENVKWGPVLPVSRVSTLVDENGMFMASPKELEGKKPDLDQVMAEFQAQLHKLQALGFRITYIDTHCAIEYNIPGLEERMNEWTKSEGLLYWNRYCSSLKPVKESGDRIEEMVSRIKAATAGQYLYLGHPAIDTPEIRNMGNQHVSGEHLAKGLVEERKLFTDARIMQACKEKGIVSIRYDEAVEITEKLPPLLNEWLYF